MGAGASSSSSSKAGRQAAYLKYDLFKEKTDELARDTKRVNAEVAEMQQELRDKLEDLSNKQEELEDLTAQSFSKVKDVLTKSEKEVRGLRSEVSHASACLGKMGGAVKRARGGAQTNEERLAELEKANEALVKRVLAAETGLDALGKGSLVDLKTTADAQQAKIESLELDLGSASAKHTIALHSQRDEILELSKVVKQQFAADAFGAEYCGFGQRTTIKFSEVDALFDALAARLTEAERRADLAEAEAAEERKARERAEKIANDASDTASKAAAAAEVAADAAGASKIKRQEAEKRARELWTKVTIAEEGKKTAEEHLMVDLQKARQDLWPAARKRAAEDVMEKVKQEASLRAAEAIQKNMEEDAINSKASLERQEAEAAERAAELAAAEAQFDQFREQLIRKILARMQQNSMQEFFDKWIDYTQDILVEKGAVQEHPDFPDGNVNLPPRPPPRPVPRQQAQEAQEAPEAQGEGEGEQEQSEQGQGEGSSAGGGGKPAEQEEEQEPDIDDGGDDGDGSSSSSSSSSSSETGAPAARVGATLESDPAEVLQQPAG
jgi:hypothetical protein